MRGIEGRGGDGWWENLKGGTAGEEELKGGREKKKWVKYLFSGF